MARGKKTGGASRKGKGNKNLKGVREKFQQLLDDYSIGQMKADLMSIDPSERLRIITGLAEYIVPKLARTEVKNEDGNTITLKVIRE